MTFYLGKDVAVEFTTENLVNGLSTTAVGGVTVGASEDGFAAKLGTADPTNITDLTAVDVSIGAMDEDITYFGMRTALKAEIKKETSLTITRKKSDAIYDVIFDLGRYGITGSATSASALMDGLEQPTIEYGYRAYIVLNSGEIMTIPNCVITAHGVTINADGTTDETLELMSMVTPIISSARKVTATSIGDL
tara:strand:+ start:194 stop:772 length:579 start_codon:yes stop_codon:yes gene_type:complete